MPDWLGPAATIIFGTIVPTCTLLIALHDRNVKARQANEQRQKRRSRRLDKRLDHLDECIDDVRNRVTRIEGAAPKMEKAA